MSPRTCCSSIYAGVLIIIFTMDTLSSSSESDNAWPPFCPHGCRCGSSQRSAMSQQLLPTIDCASQELRSLPSNLSTTVQALLLTGNRIELEALFGLDSLVNLTELDLSSNHLQDLKGLVQPMPPLRYLSVDHNEIDYIDNQTFHSLPSLFYLSVIGNKIELMHTNAFVGLTELRTLDLSSNRIFSIDPLWFRDLRSLQELVLKENDINVLRASAFWFLRALKKLDLSKNPINHIYDGAFRGLMHLEDINIHGNSLKEVPHEPLQQLIRISSIDLGGTHMAKLQPRDFVNGSAAVLKLNYMPMLRIIESGAFINMAHLEQLELNHNSHLTYIDRKAFVGLPKLSILLLNDNHLSCLEGEIRLSLPSLSLLNLQNNPIVCDCVSRWLITESSLHHINITAATCASPDSLQGQTITNTSLASQIPEQCAPRLVPLFESTYDPVLGDDLQLDCRAVGVPIPQTDWLLPDASHTKSGEGVLVLRARHKDLRHHREVLASGSLIIHYVQGIDFGDYTCLASNPKGRQEKSTHIRVKNMRANVIILHVSSSAVTMTWTSVRYDHDYQILYRQHQPNSTYHIIDIKPYMRTYTASKLAPDSHYDICMAVKHGDISIRINCTIVTTGKPENDQIGVMDLKGYVIGGTVGFLLVILTLTCTIVYFVKRYNKRKKAQEELFSDNLSQMFLASMDSMSDMTPITYENRGAEMFDEDDLEEIRSTASMATTTSSTSTMRC